MKCRVCCRPAIIDVRRHNANFCGEHFLKLSRDQAAKAVAQFDMLQPRDRVFVAVSCGKDSLAVWDILQGLGHDAEGFYVGLGIGEYRNVSADYATRVARARDLTLHTEDLLRCHRFDVPHGSRAAKRAPCSACGLTKRHLFDEAARRGGYDAIVTGHNFDDEAAVLMGNVLHWYTDYVARQAPARSARYGFLKEAKPLLRLTERETVAHCIIRGIDYLADECAMAAGNKHLAYKEQLNELERISPGAKFAFNLRILLDAQDRLAEPEAARTDITLHACERCGAPTNKDICSLCALAGRATRPVPPTIGRKTQEVAS